MMISIKITSSTGLVVAWLTYIRNITKMLETRAIFQIRRLSGDQQILLTISPEGF